MSYKVTKPGLSNNHVHEIRRAPVTARHWLCPVVCSLVVITPSVFSTVSRCYLSDVLTITTGRFVLCSLVTSLLCDDTHVWRVDPVTSWLVAFPSHPPIGLLRVLEYYSSSKLSINVLLQVLVIFYFWFQISTSGCSFLQTIDNFTPSVQRVAPVRRKTSKSASELLRYQHFVYRTMLTVTILTLTHQFTTPFFVTDSLY